MRAEEDVSSFGYQITFFDTSAEFQGQMTLRRVSRRVRG
jgi:hypothetical protein